MAEDAGIVQVGSMPVEMLDRIDGARVYMSKVEQFRTITRELLKKDRHYGVIPGTKKDSLYKAGGEVLLIVLGVAVEYEIEDASTADRVDYTAAAVGIYQGQIVGKVTRNANSGEKTFREQLAKGKTLDDLKNPILARAQKRAMVALATALGGLSDLFEEDEADVQAHAAQARSDADTAAKANSISAAQLKLVRGLVSEIGWTDEDLTRETTLHDSDLERLTKGAASKLITKLKSVQAELEQNGMLGEEQQWEGERP